MLKKYNKNCFRHFTIMYQSEKIFIVNGLKVPKREIFVTELIILSHPIWIGDLRTKAKNRFVWIVRLLFAILFFYRWLSVRQKIFRVIEWAAKNFSRILSMRQKLFHAYWVCGKNYSTPTEWALKKLILLRVFKHS